MINTLPIPKENLTYLYNSGYSMTQIAKRLSCSIHKVAYWMDQYQIPRRTLSEAVYLSANPHGDPFKIKENLNLEEVFLLGLGIGIYWGEGEKVSKHSIRVANTDPFIIKNFVRFLLEICQLEPRKLSFSIVCFNDSNLEKVKSYWSKQLKISNGKFGKIVQIPPQGKGSYKRKSEFGVCTVSASNIKLKAWIFTEIAKLKK